jgi:hypothetical protein
MIMRKLSIITLTAILVSLCLVSAASAQDTLLISYQGYLTDDGGNPVTGTPSMTFTIYDAGGVSKWTESHPAIQVNDGLFNVILGSQSALPDSVLNGEDRYLGISIESDDEIIPRTLLTSAPGAAVSRRVVGDITTKDGYLELSGPPEASPPGLVVLQAIEDSASGVFGNAESFDMAGNLEIGASPDAAGLLMTYGAADDPPDMELSVKADSNLLRIYPPSGGLLPALEISVPDDGGPAVGFFTIPGGEVMGIEPSPFNYGYGITLYDPTQPEPTPLTSLSSYFGDSTMARIQMFNPSSADPAQPEVDIVSSESGNRLTISGRDPTDGNLPALELIADAETHSFKIHPPDPCTPPDPCNPAVEISATTEHHSMMINKPSPDDNRPAIKLTANNENKIDLYYPDAESDEGIVQIGANAAEGAFIELHAADSLTVTRVMMGGSTADTGFVRLFGGDKDLEFKVLELNSHTNTGGNVKIFDPENIDGREMLRIGSSPDAAGGAVRELMASQNRLADGIGIYGFNPQPEPPGHVAFELTSEASQGGRLAVYDTEDANLVLTGGVMQLGHENIADYPTGTFSVTPTASQLTLTGDASAGDTPTITMVAGADGTRVGIGSDAPSDELYVVGDITATGAITELSSVKYKTNIKKISDALDKVKDLRGVNFNWRAADYPEMKFSESQQMGLIAEEVEKVIPQLVHSDNNGEMSVDYSKLTAVLIEAIKEQQQQIEILSRRVEELENTNTSNWQN